MIEGAVMQLQLPRPSSALGAGLHDEELTALLDDLPDFEGLTDSDELSSQSQSEVEEEDEYPLSEGELEALSSFEIQASQACLAPSVEQYLHIGHDGKDLQIGGDVHSVKRPLSSGNIVEEADSKRARKDSGSPQLVTVESPPSNPLSFRITQERLHKLLATSTGPVYWNHTLYTGPEGARVKVHYCTALEQSEIVAKQFLDERVLGFDMEWKFEKRKGATNKHASIKDNCSLLQLACEDKIALFQIALHEGETADTLVAPSLRRILESPGIIKTGVNIHRADGQRLINYLGMKPQSLFELSKLFKLVTYYGISNKDAFGLKLIGLATQVEACFGLPLAKDNRVRCSDWRKRLNEAQKIYSAADAYAGFMLYRNLEAKRQGGDPVPPAVGSKEYCAEVEKFKTTAKAEKFKSSARVKKTKSTVIAEKSELSTSLVSLEAIEADDDTRDQVANTSKKVKLPSSSAIATVSYRGTALFDALKAKRKALAVEHGVPAYVIARDLTLEDLCSKQPSSAVELLDIVGLGKQKVEKYGGAWLEIVTAHSDEQKHHPCDTALFDALKAKRKAIADEQGVAALTVAYDCTLEDLCAKRPSNATELLGMVTLRPKKANKYGDAWLEVIAVHSSDHEQKLCPGFKPVDIQKRKKKRKRTKNIHVPSERNTISAVTSKCIAHD